MVSWVDVDDNTENAAPPAHTIWGEVQPLSQSSSMYNSATGSSLDRDEIRRDAKARLQSRRHAQAIQFLAESLEPSANTELDGEVFSEKCSIPMPLEPDSAGSDGESFNKEEGDISECHVNPLDAKVNSMMQRENPQDEELMQMHQQRLVQQEAVAEEFAKLSPEEVQELKSKMPLDEQGEMTSVGSCLHGGGSCRPCLFQNTKVGCHNGILCDFCHLPHNRKTKPRPCKGKRERYRKLIDRIEQTIDDCPRQSCSAPKVQVGHGNEQFKAKVLSKLMQQMRKLQAKAGNEDVLGSIGENTKAQELPVDRTGMDGNVAGQSRRPGSISL